jgi:hypothetical protein
LVLEFVVLVVGLESLQEVSLLGILLLVFTTGMGGVVVVHTPWVLMQGRRNSRRWTPTRIPLYSY